MDKKGNEVDEVIKVSEYFYRTNIFYIMSQFINKSHRVNKQSVAFFFVNPYTYYCKQNHCKQKEIYYDTSAVIMRFIVL